MTTIETTEHPVPAPRRAPRGPGRTGPGLPALAPGLASALVWGAGQLLNRQAGKAAFFFTFFAGMVVGEIATGNYYAGMEFTARLNGGFFIRGLWGLITLGTQPREMTMTGLTEGDNSIVLMANGLIALLTLALLAVIWIWSIRDAARYRAERNAGRRAETSSAYFKRLWESAFAYIALSPGLVLLVFMSVLPVLFGILVAFTNYNRDNLPPKNLVSWVGTDNFATLFAVPSWTETFAGILVWTVVWAVVATVTTYAAGMLLAVMLASRRVRFPRVWRSVFLLPWAVPAIVSALVFRSMFNGQFGPVSQWLVDIGLTDERVYWFTDPTSPNLARAVALLVNLWLGFPFFMALVGGVLANIPDSYYEAARIDGAGPLQQFRYITLPIVQRTVTPLIILSFVHNFNNFGVIYFLTEGGPDNVDYRFAGSTDLLVTWLFKLTLDNRLYNIGAVMSLVIFVIVGAISVLNLNRTKAIREL
ncbi:MULTISPECIES: carbohydrate ABC transporter permease [Glycomyces]|uniref:Maltose/maltodextrin transport system permease protein n=2 Tax=Glycomyces TaxID=58113 RepID=A0A9X3PJJ2_9ACTN|nr:sugar ABC transporter permease [Glycomyces lechevalierae]MDA1386007.1 sugar ABC transporter permease [Glycomyces lechevalierae]MDR7340836.1 arabinogalactan oligomer/maltooligosaccharide transport system permease protein [Glycomyces lechevalierae]